MLIWSWRPTTAALLMRRAFPRSARSCICRCFCRAAGHCGDHTGRGACREGTRHPGPCRTLSWGSLFDGIGVFPLAASRCGIRPVWASEIEKAPISITKRHFPDMVHLGGYYEGGRRENPTCPYNYLRFPLSEPFSDRQPLRPCRGKIKPVLSGVSYHTGNEGCY